MWCIDNDKQNCKLFTPHFIVWNPINRTATIYNFQILPLDFQSSAYIQQVLQRSHINMWFTYISAIGHQSNTADTIANQSMIVFNVILIINSIFVRFNHGLVSVDFATIRRMQCGGKVPAEYPETYWLNEFMVGVLNNPNAHRQFHASSLKFTWCATSFLFFNHLQTTFCSFAWFTGSDPFQVTLRSRGHFLCHIARLIYTRPRHLEWVRWHPLRYCNVWESFGLFPFPT